MLTGLTSQHLKDEIVTNDTVQTIISKNSFTDLFVQNNSTTSSTVNGVNLSELEKSMSTDQADLGHFDHLLIHGSLIIEGDVSMPQVNQINLSKLENIILKFGSNNITTLIISGNSLVKNLEAANINGLNMSSIVYCLQNPSY